MNIIISGVHEVIQLTRDQGSLKEAEEAEETPCMVAKVASSTSHFGTFFLSTFNEIHDFIELLLIDLREISTAKSSYKSGNSHPHSTGMVLPWILSAHPA